MKPIIHLMTMTPHENNGNLSKSDQRIWNTLTSNGVAGTCFTPRDACVSFSNDTCVISVHGNKLQTDNALLVVRLMRGAPERAYEIAKVFKSLGGSVSDPVEALVYSAGKLLPYLARKGNIAYIPSYFFDSKSVSLDELLTVVSYPFIVKPQEGFRGQGVVLIHNADEYSVYQKSALERSLIAQNYLADITNEYRATVIGGKCIGIISKIRTRASTDAFSADLDTDIAVHDDAVMAFAELAAKLGDADVYGADIAKTSSGELYLIENNRCPDIVSFGDATGIDVGAALLDFYHKRFFDK